MRRRENVGPRTLQTRNENLPKKSAYFQNELHNTWAAILKILTLLLLAVWTFSTYGQGEKKFKNISRSNLGYKDKFVWTKICNRIPSLL